MKRILSLIFTILVCSHLQGNNINWSSPPKLISGVTPNATNPVLAMDANGNALAAWVEDNRIKASIHLVRGNWNPAVTVSAPGASSPCLTLDSNGNATLLWVGNGIIYASKKNLNDNWTTPIALSTAGATSPAISVDAVGNVIAVWTRGGNIESSTKLLGMNWQPKVIITSSAAATPDIAIGGSGSNTRAVIVWQATFNGIPVICSSTKSLSGNWTNQTLLSDPTHNAASPSIAMDVNANAIAVWYEYDTIGFSYTNVILKTSERLALNGMWGEDNELSAPGIRNPSSLTANISFDKFGNAIAVWNTSFDDVKFNLQSSIKPVNGQWSEAIDLIDPNLFVYNESISVTSFGETLCVYMYYNGNDLLIQSIESNINGALNNKWSVPITISLGSDNAYPIIAATINNNTIYAAAIWRSFGAAHSSIFGVTGSKPLVLPASNLNVIQNSNNFGLFIEYSNSLSWDASTDPNAVGYMIFRNGLFLGQVSSNVLEFVDYNRDQNGSVTYSVTAIDSQQMQSAPISVSFP